MGKTFAEIKVQRERPARYVRPLVFLSLMLSLGGCESPEDMVAEKPLVAFNTSAKPEDVRDCLISGRPTIQVSTTQTGYTVFYAIGSTTHEALWLVKIERTSTGSHVEAHARHAVIRRNVVFDDQVQPCLDKLPRL